jgi:hypothetical protein
MGQRVPHGSQAKHRGRLRLVHRTRTVPNASTPAWVSWPLESGIDAIDSEEHAVAKRHGPRVNNDKRYEGLRKKGMNKSRAAATRTRPGPSAAAARAPAAPKVVAVAAAGAAETSPRRKLLAARAQRSRARPGNRPSSADLSEGDFASAPTQKRADTCPAGPNRIGDATAGPACCAAGLPAPDEWAPRCNLAGGPLRRVVLTNASGKLHNRIGIAAQARRGAYGDGRARQSCVLNKGVDPPLTALQMTPAQPPPVATHLSGSCPTSAGPNA